MGKYIHLFETNAEFQAMYNDDEIRFFAYANAYGEEDDDAGVSIIFNMPEPVFRLS